MRLLHAIRSLIRTVFGRHTFEHAMSDELQFHRDAYVADLVRSGVEPADAARRAAIEFGNVEGLKEELRAARGLRLFDELQQDTRFAMRRLRQGRGAAVIAVLALGVGVNIAVFSVVYAALLRPLPHPDPDRLVWVTSYEIRSGREHQMSPLDFFDFERRTTALAHLAAYYPPGFTLTGNGRAERVPGARASSGIFDVFGVRPALGRGFLPAEDRRGASPVVVISHEIWARRYARNPSIIGTSILLSGNPYTVVGVLPEGFRSPAMRPRMPEVWVPIGLDGNVGRRDSRMLRVIGRLKPETTVETAQADLDVIARALGSEYRDIDDGTGVRVAPLLEQLTRDVRPSLLILVAAVGALLLVACGNAAALLIGRTLERRHEFATRLALGAGRRRITRQILAENMVIGVIAAGIGFALAYLAAGFLVATATAAGVPRANEITIDIRTLLVGVALSLGCTAICAMVAARDATRRGVAIPGAGGSRTVTVGRQRSRVILIASEAALSLALLVGGALLMRSFYELQSTRPGFDARNTLTTRLSPPAARYPAGPVLSGFYDRVLERVRALPGVESASVVDWLPLGGFSAVIGFTVEGRQTGPGATRNLAELRVVDPDYFRTLRIPIRAGRVFDSRDGDEAPRVAVINESLARTLFDDRSPLGQRLALDRTGAPTVEIVGVVGDVRELALQIAPGGGIFAPKSQSPWVNYETRDMVVRTSLDPAAVAPAIGVVLRELEPDVPLGPIQGLDEVVATSLVRPRFYAWAVALFAMTAMLLAAFGIYGAVASAVTLRTRELGVRLALGATRGSVLARAASYGALPTLCGLVAGVPLSFVAGRIVRQQLFGVEPTDAFTLLSVAGGMAVVALVAAAMPALRAARIDPAVTLRHEGVS